MRLEYMIELGSVAVMTVQLWLFVPRDRLREAFVIFSSTQILTWLLGTVAVELRLLEYPVRLISYATRTSFTFEFFTLPAICVLFVLYFPNAAGLLRQQLHYVVYCSAITGAEYVLERYTDCIAYTGWQLYWTWLSLYATFFLSRCFYRKFYQEKAVT